MGPKRLKAVLTVVTAARYPETIILRVTPLSEKTRTNKTRGPRNSRKSQQGVREIFAEEEWKIEVEGKSRRGKYRIEEESRRRRESG